MTNWLKRLFRRAPPIRLAGVLYVGTTDESRIAFGHDSYATDWDIAQAAPSEAAHEAARIEYRFLGITGMEDE